MVTGIILAGGKGERMGLGGSGDKCFLSLGPQPVIAWSLLAFEQCEAITQIVVVVRKGQEGAVRGAAQMFGISKLVAIVNGGSRRQDSVFAGLKAVSPDTRYVAIHDAARPCVTTAIIADTVKFAKRCGSGVAGHPVVDTIKVVGKGVLVEQTPPRDKLWAVQTPQTFNYKELTAAYESTGASQKGGPIFTDDAAILEAAGGQVRLVATETPNPKITTMSDLAIAAALLKLM